MSKHRLSLTVAAGAPVTLRIDLKAVGAAQNGYATWSTFGVGSEASKYSLSVTGFADGASPIGDGLAYHDGQPFSTRDRDYAADLGSNCPVTYPGAWWFLHCFYSNLNGVYRPNGINAGMRRVSSGIPIGTSTMEPCPTRA